MTFQLGGPSATDTRFEIVDRAWTKVMYSFSGEAPGASLAVISTGNVGIGTVSPSAKLDVLGVGRIVQPNDPLAAGAVAAKILSYSPSPYGILFRGYETGVHSIQVQREANDAQLFGLSLQPLGGNVGIGTTNPSYRLVVSNGGAVGGEFDANGTIQPGGFGIQAYNRSTSAYVPLGLYGSSILIGGNVGIGTTSPSSKVHLYSTSAPWYATVLAEGSVGRFAVKDTDDVYVGSIDIQNYIAFNLSAGTDASYGAITERMRINASGNVGIGTTSPATLLDINGATTFRNTLFLASEGILSWSSDLGNGQGGLVIGSVASKGVLLRGGASGTGIFLNSSNNVGIGTTSPGYTLDVSGTFRVTGDVTFASTLTMGTSGTQYIRMGRFPNSTTNTGEAWIGRASDRNTGTMTVQLGGNSASNRSFEVVDYAWSVVLFSVSSGGTATASGDVIAYSDKRVKENISPILNPLQKVLGMKGVYYNRTDLDDKSRKIGFIAQDIKDILPEVVTYNKEQDRYGVSYGNITALLIEAIKEQQTQIMSQQHIITDLQSRLTKLESE